MSESELIEQLHKGERREREYYVNSLLDERKAVKLRLAELESELEELGVKFYENNAFEAIFCEKDLTS